MRKPKRRSSNDLSTRKKRKKSFRVCLFKMSVVWITLLSDILKLVCKIIGLFK